MDSPCVARCYRCLVESSCHGKVRPVVVRTLSLRHVKNLTAFSKDDVYPDSLPPAPPSSFPLYSPSHCFTYTCSSSSIQLDIEITSHPRQSLSMARKSTRLDIRLPVDAIDWSEAAVLQSSSARWDLLCRSSGSILCFHERGDRPPSTGAGR